MTQLDRDHAHGNHADGSVHAGHHHGPVDPNASWLVRHRDVALSVLCGVLGLSAFIGQAQFGLDHSWATALYVAAYFAGAYELAGHTLPTILRGKFDVEFLMLVAALGAAALGQWAEGTLLLFLFSIGHALEGFAMDRARKAIEALGSVTPKTCWWWSPSPWIKPEPSPAASRKSPTSLSRRAFPKKNS